MEKKSQKEKEVIKASAAIEIANSITLLQRKAWNVLLAHAYQGLWTKQSFSMKVKDLMTSVNFGSKNEDYLKKALKGMVETVIEWDLLDKDGDPDWGVFTLLADARINKGLVLYSYSQLLKEKLYNPKVYARIKLAIQARFSSKYALALYELLVDYFFSKQGFGETPMLSLVDFRKLMGVEETEYRQFKELAKRVIKPAVSEVNEKSDLFTEVEYQRDSHKVSHLKFHTRLKTDQEENFLSLAKPDLPERQILIPAIDEYNRTTSRLNDFGITDQKAIDQILTTFTPEGIEETLNLTEMKFKRGMIKSVRGYLVKAFKIPKGTVINKTKMEIEKEEKDRVERDAQAREAKRQEQTRQQAAERQQHEADFLEWQERRLAEVMKERGIDPKDKALIVDFKASLTGEDRDKFQTYGGKMTSPTVQKIYHAWLCRRFLTPAEQDIEVWLASGHDAVGG